MKQIKHSKIKLFLVGLCFFGIQPLFASDLCQDLFVDDTRPSQLHLNLARPDALDYFVGNGYSFLDLEFGSGGSQSRLKNSFINDSEFVSIKDGQLAIFNIANKTVLPIPEFQVKENKLKSGDFGPYLLPNKKEIVFVENLEIKIFDLEAKTFVSRFQISSSKQNEVSWNAKLSMDGEKLYWIGSQGTLQIISLKTQQVIYSSEKAINYPNSKRIGMKGFREHIIESPNGEYVFFVSFDEGIKNSGKSVLFDLKNNQEVFARSSSVLDFLSGNKNHRFSGVISAMFFGQKLMIQRGADGYEVSTGLLHSTRTELIFDLDQHRSIKPRYDHMYVSKSFQDRLYNLFFSTKNNLIVKIESTLHRTNFDITEGYKKVKDGLLFGLRVINPETDLAERLDLREISMFHQISDLKMVNDDLILFRGQYIGDTSSEGFRLGRYGRVGLELEFSQRYQQQQVSWFYLDLKNKKVTRIYSSEFDAISNTALGKSYRNHGVSPDGRHLILSNNGSQFTVFNIE